MWHGVVGKCSRQAFRLIASRLLDLTQPFLVFEKSPLVSIVRAEAALTDQTGR